MERRRSPMDLLRAPLGHWLIAVIFAVAVAWGLRTWLLRQAVQSAETATLSWDAAAARHQDPGLADTADPAVAMAQSILSDSVVDSLAQTAPVPSAERATRIGEFRSRLEIRQPSATLLQVQFRDANPEQAEKTTNAVAGSLASEVSAPAGAPPPVMPSSVETRPAAPVKPRVAVPASQQSSALAHSLSQMEAELSSTQKRLDGISSGSWERNEHAGEPSSYRQSKQQQLLTAQIGAALKEVGDWRADPRNSGKVQEPLRQIQEALLSVWPASRAWKGARSSAVLRGFNAAGVDAGRLREERAQFTHALEVVQKQQQAVERLEPAQTANPPAPPNAAPAAESSASAPAPSAGADSRIAESEIPKTSAESPFRLLRPAGTPVRSPIWPAALAGFCCGLVYLGAASLRRHAEAAEVEEYADEGAVATQRLITPAKPIRPAEFFAGADPRPAEAKCPAETGPRPAEPDVRFAEVDSRPAGSAPRFAEFAVRPAPAAAQPSEVVLPPPRIEAPDPPQSAPEADPQEIVIAAENQRRPYREVPEDDDGDPWVNNIIKGLSETSIGRMFENTAASESEKDNETETERRLHPDRMAG